MERHQIPGLAIAVVDRGRVVLTKGYGVRRLPDGRLPDENTVFALGSVSKALTALGAMLLVQEGRIAIDEPIGTYLPQLPRKWQAITVRQFLTHTSGIPNFPKLPTFEAAVEHAARLPMQFPPGTKQLYTNANFSVIGRLIEVTSGQPYLTFMQERIFGPLGMESTGSYATHLRGDHALGYRWGNDRPVPGQLNITPHGIPSGGLASSLADMLRLDAAQREGKLLKPETLRLMYTITVPPGDEHPWHFTPGWQARMGGAEQVIAKNGMVVGYASMYQMVPSRGISIIMLWNLSGHEDDLWRESATLLEQCFGIPRAKPAVVAGGGAGAAPAVVAGKGAAAEPAGSDADLPELPTPPQPDG